MILEINRQYNIGAVSNGAYVFVDVVEIKSWTYNPLLYWSNFSIQPRTFF